MISFQPVLIAIFRSSVKNELYKCFKVSMMHFANNQHYL